MNILQKIVEHKKKEVSEQKKNAPTQIIGAKHFFSSPTVSLKEYLLRKDKSGIIAEFKRKSPSKGEINPDASVERTSIGYAQAGASALSILTDQEFFGGSNDDLIIARKYNSCPILRKDFMIDEYQIIEAKSIGADAILLIAAILQPQQIKSFASIAKSLGLEVLLEVHDENELNSNLNANVDLIGVNNRNLKTFEVSVEKSKNLSALIPTDVVKISESGINSPETIIELRKYGYQGFLMGENFMKHSQPEAAAKDFIESLNRL